MRESVEQKKKFAVCKYCNYSSHAEYIYNAHMPSCKKNPVNRPKMSEKIKSVDKIAEKIAEKKEGKTAPLIDVDLDMKIEETAIN